MKAVSAVALFSSFPPANQDDSDLATHQGDFAKVKSVLVCGDGDLSYSAWLAPQLAKSETKLVATVLEQQDAHHDVYKNSREHCENILSFENHEVRFGVDATQLDLHFPTGKEEFDRVIFNFPHWRGKANNKRNRELLNAFFQSASRVLSRVNGEVHVALCQGQGGTTAKNGEEWRRSWMVSLYAAEQGLLLKEAIPYKPEYDLSSHRGVDRPFRVGTVPMLYKFSFPSRDRSVKDSLQLCCRHELHVLLPSNTNLQGLFSIQGLVSGDDILRFARGLVPDGIRVEVPIRRTLYSEELNGGPATVVFLIVYCGEQAVLTRQCADMYRARLETELSKHLPLRKNRMGRLVSRPFPYPLLQHFIDEHLKDQ